MIKKSPARVCFLSPLATGGGRVVPLLMDATAALSIQITALRYPKISRRSGGRWWPIIVGAPLTLLAYTHMATTAHSQVRFPLVPDSAQKHGIGAHPDHGQTTHPCLHTWCCTYKDCRPLADGVVKQTFEGYDIPLPDGRRAIVSYTDKRIRQMKPECHGQEFGQREWACFNEVDGEWQVRCFYPRGGLF